MSELETAAVLTEAEQEAKLKKMSNLSSDLERQIARIQFFSAIPKKPFFKQGAKYLSKIFLFSNLLGLVLSIVALSLTFASAWLGILLGLIPTLAYLGFKEEIKDKQEKHKLNDRYRKTIPMSLTFFVTSVLAGTMNPAVLSYPLTRVIVLVGMIASFIAGQVLIRKKKVKASFDKLKTVSLYEVMAGGELIEPGDAIIGYDPETYKPNRLPEEDRYLHMLFLGPTGSGKTAMSLTPMIWRDMNNPNMGITVIEPKQDFAEKVYAMAKIAGREVVYFNPLLDNCPYFNPLYGPEGDVIECMCTTFGMFSADSSQFFRDANDRLLRYSLKVLKGVKKNDATLIDLSMLIHNTSNAGSRMIKEYEKVPTRNEAEEQEKLGIVSWFLTDYFTGLSGERGATKTYENTSAIRTQVAKLNSNEYLRSTLNPPAGHGSDLDFADALARGTVTTVATVQGKLQDLGKFLGYFIILQFQAAVFSRPGNEETRRGHMLYIDEFQVYANSSFENMLTQGRSYRVASHLATQTRALIGANAGKEAQKFIGVVSTNARNKVVYPGGNFEDASYYSKEFGEKLQTSIDRGISRQVVNPLYGFGGYRAPNESIKEVEKMVPFFSPTEIMKQEFGRVIVSLIKNKSLSDAKLVELSFISYDLKKEIDRIVEEFNNAHHLCDVKERDQINHLDFTKETSIAQAIPEGVPGLDEVLDFGFDLGSHMGFQEVSLPSDFDLELDEALEFEDEFVGDEDIAMARNSIVLQDGPLGSDFEDDDF